MYFVHCCKVTQKDAVTNQNIIIIIISGTQIPVVSIKNKITIINTHIVTRFTIINQTIGCCIVKLLLIVSVG